MSTLRQPYNELSPEVYNALVQAKMALEKSELDGALIELVYLRVSQINGCAFCLEMHSKALRKRGAKQAGRPGGLAGKRPFQRCRARGAGVGRISHPYCRKPCARRRLSAAAGPF